MLQLAQQFVTLIFLGVCTSGSMGMQVSCSISKSWWRQNGQARILDVVMCRKSQITLLANQNVPPIYY